MNRSIRASVLAVGLVAALSACGKDDEKTPSTSGAPATPETPKPAAALKGEGWIGATVDPSIATGKVRALAFFKPG